MSHAEKCPVCDGSGVYKGNSCHGCSGKGWVQVGTDYPEELKKEYIPYPVYPYEPPPVYPTPINPLYPWITYQTSNKMK